MRKDPQISEPRLYALDEALKAQAALRSWAGPGPEMFPVKAFVGMISDEVESLRQRGHSDDDIAAIIRNNSSIEITGNEIAETYASSEMRHQQED